MLKQLHAHFQVRTIAHCHLLSPYHTQGNTDTRKMDTHSQWGRCFLPVEHEPSQRLTWDREDEWEMSWQSKEVKIYDNVFHAKRAVSGTGEKERLHKFPGRESWDEKSSGEEHKLNSRSRYCTWGYINTYTHTYDVEGTHAGHLTCPIT